MAVQIAFPTATAEQRAMLDDIERAIARSVDELDLTTQITTITNTIVQETVPTVGTVWFEWNATDLSQFDARVDGASVNAGSNVSVVSFAGANWIQLHLDFNAGTVSNQAQNFYLPIATTPPTANYKIEADFIVTVESSAFNLCGFLLAVRFSSTTDGYVFHHYGRQVFNNLAFESPGRLTSPESGNFTDLAFPPILGANADMQIGAVNHGFTRVSLAVQGTGTESLVRYDTSIGGYQGIDTSPTTPTGKAALGMSGLNDSTFSTKTALVRNIRCYDTTGL